MAVQRDHPYAGYNFLIDLGDGETEGPHAGFAQVIGLELEIAVIEYRNGNARENHVTKLPGLHKSGNVTLKRGISGSLALWQWIVQARQGDLQARRNVTIRLQSEDHAAVVETWHLQQAWPSKYVGPRLDAQANDIAIEELVLSHEGLEVE